MAKNEPTTPSLVRGLLEMMFPQLAVNRIIPSAPEPDRRGDLRVRWRWIRHRLQPEQRRWVAHYAPLYWVRWFIAWGVAAYCSVKLGPPGGALLYVGFTFFAGWTLLGVALAQGFTRLERRRQEH